MNIQIVQGSDEWVASRLGKLTASRVSEIMRLKRGGVPASREKVLFELLTERISGLPTDFYITPAMKWGTDTEPRARNAYEANMGVIVDQVALVDHPSIKGFGASPDGLVGDDGLVEIKCPTPATHIKTFCTESVHYRYIIQMTVQMMCTGRLWCDFVSFDPRLPEHAQFFLKRYQLDYDLVKRIEVEAMSFLDELDELEKRFK